MAAGKADKQAKNQFYTEYRICVDGFQIGETVLPMDADDDEILRLKKEIAQGLYISSRHIEFKTMRTVVRGA